MMGWIACVYVRVNPVIDLEILYSGYYSAHEYQYFAGTQAVASPT